MEEAGPRVPYLQRSTEFLMEWYRCGVCASLIGTLGWGVQRLFDFDWVPRVSGGLWVIAGLLGLRIVCAAWRESVALAVLRWQAGDRTDVARREAEAVAMYVYAERVMREHAALMAAEAAHDGADAPVRVTAVRLDPKALPRRLGRREAVDGELVDESDAG